jgi:hypothetical protein
VIGRKRSFSFENFNSRFPVPKWDKVILLFLFPGEPGEVSPISIQRRSVSKSEESDEGPSESDYPEAFSSLIFKNGVYYNHKLITGMDSKLI